MIDGEDRAPQSALLYMDAAIRILDSCSVPAQIAAHADLARAQLEQWLSCTKTAKRKPEQEYSFDEIGHA